MLQGICGAPAAAYPRDWGKVLPWSTGSKQEQEAVEGSFIADCELARTDLGRRHEGRDEGLQLSPQSVLTGRLPWGPRASRPWGFWRSGASQKS
ncbi:hypothetical protein O987_04605 [Comamonas testosteroni TK102]|uniref:Uncharacterized protein n=1 Tax=Comamonas testosteroni TK102 TaxID=1392005 RepID=A0A076PK69_COMTE|nr:hypothetical protein O987_04605 [Comamonas testosteroni TK102]